MRSPVRYSWILPSKDEARSLPQLTHEISRVMAGYSYEIVCVNDASMDDTVAVVRRLRQTNRRILLISLSHASGKWAALVCGLGSARGSIIITIDADLQDDPREVAKLLPHIDRGYDVVSGWRKRRLDPFSIIVLSTLGNWLVSCVTRRTYHDLNSPMKVYQRNVLDRLPTMGSFLRFSLLFADELGFHTIEVPIVHRKRRWGKSKFGVRKYLRIFYDFFLIRLLFWGSGGLRKLDRS